MGPRLCDELSVKSPKLSLSSLPIHKPPEQDRPGTVTPPLHPTVRVPFKWEEAPGRPRPTNTASPIRPSSGDHVGLELPPRLLVGPRGMGRSASDRFWLEGPGSRNSLALGLVESENGSGPVQNHTKAHIVSCRWPSGEWDIGGQGRGSFDFLRGNDIVAEVSNMKVKITRCNRSSKGSLHRLSYRSSRLLESIYKSIKQMVARKHK